VGSLEPYGQKARGIAYDANDSLAGAHKCRYATGRSERADRDIPTDSTSDIGCPEMGSRVFTGFSNTRLI
jgi:hypothetical protein